MRHFYLLSSLLWLAPTAWAGPEDVPPDPVQGLGELRPHHQLHLPAEPEAPRPLPAPQTDPVALENEHTILIQQSASLLAQHGNLNPRATPFPNNAWQYLEYVQATKQLNALPAEVQPPALRENIIDLLRLRGEPPRGAKDDWFASRMRALSHIGATKEATNLASSVPSSLANSIDAFAMFQALLQSGQKQLACESIADRPKPFEMDDGQWDRVRLFCDGVLGNFPKVEVALAIAEERGTPYVDWFVTLLEHLQYQTERPTLSKTMTAIDQAMLATTGPTADGEIPDEKPLARKAANAVPAITKLIRINELDETSDWLALLDRAEGDSARSYVLHELVRFLRSDRQTARSQEAMTLPPFTNTQSVVRQDKLLLRRFFRVMESFEYDVPAITQNWLSRNWPDDTIKPKAATMQQLGNFARTGNSAGYVLTLARLFADTPLGKLPDDTISTILFDLKQLRQDVLAKAIAAESIVTMLD